jgi:hypothetical protein
MHLHDRHGAHLTLLARLKQAGQSAASGLNGCWAEGFPYIPSASIKPRALRLDFVSISLHAVT